jgi:hypothetical protein
MSDNRLEEFLSSGSRRRPRPHVAPNVEAARLCDACAIFHRRYTFQVGDFIVIKRGIRIESTRGEGSEPVYVVLDFFPDAEMILNPENPMSYGLCYDLLIGHYDEDGDFIFSPMDSRRVEPWPRRSDAKKESFS